jgi:RimJ/RimL family protein N-acetyltransferase
MNIAVSSVEPERIAPFRDLYRQELNCQIILDSAHSRKNAQSFLLEADGIVAGYGSAWVSDSWMGKGTLFEFYVLPIHRSHLFTLFNELVRVTQAPRIHAQTNDPFLSVLIYEHVPKIIAKAILFEDCKTTNYTMERVTFRCSTPEDKDRIFRHRVEPVGDWLLEKDGRIIATGGVLYHYNRPYGDIFMEIDEAFRRRGYGRFLVQELKKVCYQSGSVPAARCDTTNLASRRTLEAAGFTPCGRLIYGDTDLANQK